MLQLQKCFDEFLETLLHSLNRDVGENCRHCPQYFNILQFYSHMVRARGALLGLAQSAPRIRRFCQLTSIPSSLSFMVYMGAYYVCLLVCTGAQLEFDVFDTGALCACTFHVLQGTMACSHLFGRQAFQRMAFFLLGESNHASNANQVRAHFPTLNLYSM